MLWSSSFPGTLAGRSTRRNILKKADDFSYRGGHSDLRHLLPTLVLILTDDNRNRLAVMGNSHHLVPSPHGVYQLAKFSLDFRPRHLFISFHPFMNDDKFYACRPGG